MSWLLKLYPGDGAMLLLANALAQATLVALLAWIIGATLARRNAALRYAVYLAALAVVLASPLTAFTADRLGLSVISIPVRQAAPAEAPSLARQPEPRSAVIPTPTPAPAVVGEGPRKTAGPTTPSPVSAAPVAPAKPGMTPSEMLRAGLAALLVTWAAGALFLLGRMLHGWGVLTSLRHELEPLDERGLEDVLARVRAALAAKKLPPIMVSGIVGTPLTVGLFKPAVVLPGQLPHALAPDELVSVLTHECAHILHRDHLVGFMQRLVEMLYWPLPPVHVLNKRLAAAREELCDNYVLRSTQPQEYARCLVNMARKTSIFQRMPATVGLVHPRWRMEERIKGIVDKRRKLMTRMNTWALGAVVAVFLAMGVVVAGCKVGGEKEQAPLGAERDPPPMSEKEIEKALESPDPLVRIRAWTARIKGGRHIAAICLQGRALDYVRAGMPERAVVDLDKLIKSDNWIVSTWLLRGLAYYAQGRYKEALADFEHDFQEGVGPERFIWGQMCRLRLGMKPSPKFMAGMERRPDKYRQLARLFVGVGSVDDYYEAVQKSTGNYTPREMKVGPPGEGEVKRIPEELAADRKEHHRQQSALAAFYIGEWHAIGGRKPEAIKWMTRAADDEVSPCELYDGGLLIGRGGLAQWALKKLRERGITIPAESVRFHLVKPDKEKRSGLYAAPTSFDLEPDPAKMFARCADKPQKVFKVGDTGRASITLVGKLPNTCTSYDFFRAGTGSVGGGRAHGPPGAEIEIPVKFVKWKGATKEPLVLRAVYLTVTLPPLSAGKYRATILFRNCRYYLEDKSKIEGPDADAPAWFLPLTCNFEVRAAGAESRGPALDGTGWSEPYPRGVLGEWPEPGEAKGGVAEVTDHGLKTKVVWMRGGNIFLAAGTEQGVALNVEFALTRGGRKVGTVKVHKLSGNMALCRAVSLVEAPHVGDTAAMAEKVSWGKAVGGLRAGLSAKPAKFSSNSSNMDFQVVAHNASGRKLTMEDIGRGRAWAVRLKPKGSGKGGSWWGRIPDDGRDPFETVTLAGGERLKVTVGLCAHWFTWDGPPRKRPPGAVHPVQLPPGKYEATAKYEFPEGGDRQWRGKVTTGAVQIEVVAPLKLRRSSIAGRMKLGRTDRIVVTHAPRADFGGKDVKRIEVRDAAVIRKWLLALDRIPFKGPGRMAKIPGDAPENRIEFFSRKRKLAVLRTKGGGLDSPARAGWDFYGPGADEAFVKLIEVVKAKAAAKG